ncbi:MAG: nucleotidyl transferase AbiEii/AbiGii toxin family protein [Myxococcota bacterium]|jgi:predicted nucleotidyltransferase component of viral defense system
MIPLDFITEWRRTAPWIHDSQVEQDLLLSRALVEIFKVPEASDALAFRGGTALYKLHLTPPARYSEDIDLVQVAAGPIGVVLDAVRARLDPWLGAPRRTLKEGRVVLLYRMQSEGPTPLPLRLKIEINSREHFSVFDLVERQYDLRSRWYSGDATIKTYELDELLGTKLRALYQRKKGRDLFDLWTAHCVAGSDPERIVTCFLRYLEEGGQRVSRAEFEANLAAKLADPMFVRDIEPLLAPRAKWDLEDAGRYVREELLVRLPGEPWKGGEA